jgi:AcrR family transcriptional regulator
MARPADPNARASLIAAARAEFAKRGLVGARIEDITAACRLSKGAFYLHFSSKEALFREVVAGFSDSMEALVAERVTRFKRFVAEHGPLDERDLSERTPRYQQLIQLETDLDLHLLELIWTYRDVVHVLIRGSQGTEFESHIWELVDRRVASLTADFQLVQRSWDGRPDVSPQMFGTLVVGTYLLLGQQMSRMRERPDLALWAVELQRLFREGAFQRLPAHAPLPPLRIAAATSPRRDRARKPVRKNSRKP